MSAQNPPNRRAGSVVFSFIGMSAVAGVLVAAAVTPAVAIAGLSASGTIGIFESLPGYLEIDKLAQISSVYAKGEGGSDTKIAQFYAQNREEVPTSEMSPWFEAAAISAEDNEFMRHGGINIGGTVRAFFATLTGQSSPQGGSGITQQLAKNLLIEKAEANPDPVARDKEYATATALTIDRKLTEMNSAIKIEKKFSKPVIMNKYLNVFNVGGNFYGVEAASMGYFGVHAKDATLAQAATIVAIPNNPEVLRIDRPNNPENGEANGYERTRARRDHTLGLMLREGKITQEQQTEAINTPITPVVTRTPNGCEAAKGAEYFCQYVKNLIKLDKAFGPDPDTRYDNFRRGGYDIYTTLDLRLQQKAQEELDRVIPKVIEGTDIAGTSVSVEVKTGRVLMMVESKDFTEDPEVAATGQNYTSLNFNVDKELGGSSGFSDGSSHKIFTLANWVAKGHSVDELVDGTKRNFSPFSDRCSEPYTAEYTVNNDRFAKVNRMISVREAIQESYNTAVFDMYKGGRLDLCDTKEISEKFHMHRADGQPLEHYPASVIGSNEVAPVAVAVAVSGFSNGGQTCSAVAIDRVLRRDGSEVVVPKSDCVQSIDLAAVTEANKALKSVMTSGTGRGSDPGDGTPLIGKSGTAEDNFDSWMTASSSQVSTSSWVGNVAPHNGSKVDLRTFNLANVPADRARHEYMRPILKEINRLYPGGAFPATKEERPREGQLTVPDVRGMAAASAESTLKGFGFKPVKGEEVDDATAAGKVVRTDPPPGTSAAKGSSVTYYLSAGSRTTGDSAVPNVTGKVHAVALAELAAAGFTTRQEDVSVNDQAIDKLVARTEPAAGAQVKAGTTIVVFTNDYRPPPAPEPGPPPARPPGPARPTGRVRPAGRRCRPVALTGGLR